MRITFEKTSRTAPEGNRQPSGSHGVRTHIPPHLTFPAGASFERGQLPDSLFDKAAMIFSLSCVILVGLFLGAAVSIGLLFFA